MQTDVEPMEMDDLSCMVEEEWLLFLFILIRSFECLEYLSGIWRHFLIASPFIKHLYSWVRAGLHALHIKTIAAGMQPILHVDLFSVERLIWWPCSFKGGHGACPIIGISPMGAHVWRFGLGNQPQHDRLPWRSHDILSSASSKDCKMWVI